VEDSSDEKDGDAEVDAEVGAEVGAEEVGAEEVDAEEVFIYEPAKPGRPTKEHVAAVRQCRGEMLTLIKSLAEEHGISPARVLDEITSAFSGASSRVRNPWNIYCKMATHPDWSTREVQRIAPHFDPATHDMPTLLPEHLSTMYQRFIEAHPDQGHLKILQDFEQLHVLGAETTIALRQRRVTSAAKKIQHVVRYQRPFPGYVANLIVDGRAPGY
jgi:hypothetical protein